MLVYESKEARKHVEEIDAKVLSNRKPPYPIIGGLFDALTDAGGMVMSLPMPKPKPPTNFFRKRKAMTYIRQQQLLWHRSLMR